MLAKTGVERPTVTELGVFTSAAPPSNFAKNVLDLLSTVEYRRCDKGEDRETMYRLRYRSYLASGMVSPNASRMVTDRFDDLPNCMNFGVHIDGEMVSTIRLHHLTCENPDSPTAYVFDDVLGVRIAAGETFIDPSRFAADPAATAQFPYLPYMTLRLAVMACVYFEPDFCLSTIRPDHAAFYRRIFDSKQVGSLRQFPGLNYDVVLCQAHYTSVARNTMGRYPFFKPSPMEQRLMFGKPGVRELDPLTILPTARYYSRAA